MSTTAAIAAAAIATRIAPAAIGVVDRAVVVMTVSVTVVRAVTVGAMTVMRMTMIYAQIRIHDWAVVVADGIAARGAMLMVAGSLDHLPNQQYHESNYPAA